MKKKLEDFLVLKYAIDRLMATSLTDNNVYKTRINNGTSNYIYSIPAKDFNKTHEYICFDKFGHKLFILRTKMFLMSVGLIGYVYSKKNDDTRYEDDVVSYIEISVNTYTMGQLVDFVERRKVEIINKRRHDIRETWRDNALNNIKGADNA